MPERRFTEKETTQIVRRAVEIQSQGHSTAPGNSESELRAAARELGVDDAALSAALAELGSNPIDRKAGFFGGPYTFEVDQMVDGEMTEALWEDVLADLRRTFGEAGKVERRGNTYEWTGTGGGTATTSLTVQSGEGISRIRLIADSSALGFLPYMIVLLLPFITVGALAKLAMPAGVEWGIGLSAWLGWFFVARGWGNHWVRLSENKCQGLVDRLSALLTKPDGLRGRLETASVSADTLSESRLQES